MCGISGCVYRDPDKPVNEMLLRAMTEIIRHRGPDGEGFYSGPGAGLGFRRLSIIDLATGDQPIANEDRSLVLVCNGEIYNYIELRNLLSQKGHFFQTKSDVEVILHLYEEYEADCLKYLRGMFAFALWDTNKQQLFLARDRLGIKPLFYGIGKDETLYFGSEQKSILITKCIEREINSQALHDLFTFGFALTPRTFFRKILQVPPGHFLIYKCGQISVKQYWDLSFPDKHDRKRLSEDCWAEALLDKLKEAVRIHMRSDVPVGAWLSGGIDSSTVASLMKQVTSVPIQTFSLAFENQPDYDEVGNQKTLGQFPGFEFSNQRVVFNNQHFDLFFKSLWHDENPTTSGTRIAKILLSEVSGHQLKVVLTGEGADELFGGYPWYGVDKVCHPFSVLPTSIRKLMLLGPVIPKFKPWSSQVFLAPRSMNLNRFGVLIGTFGKEKIMMDLFSNHFQEQVLNSVDGYLNMTLFPQFDQWHNFEKIQYVETKTRLVDYIIHGLDRSSMAHSLEARVPFLDHELVEFCTHIPPSLKMKYLKEKYILRKAMKNHLPPEILRRKKKGLATPSKTWLRNCLPEPIEEMLSESKLHDKGYFNVVFVRNLLKDHRSRKADYSRALMAILGVQAWDDLFVKGCKNL
jgi:asparagine synthase (glutamine-hydrolysing)